MLTESGIVLMHKSYIRTLLINAHQDQYLEMAKLLEAIDDVDYWTKKPVVAIQIQRARHFHYDIII